MAPIASRCRQVGTAVKPQRGLLIPQDMQLSLSTNTTRTIVLETGVTLSGQISGPGDGHTSAGQVTEPFPRGDVLGTAHGRSRRS